jgi:hypothetical protein
MALDRNRLRDDILAFLEAAENVKEPDDQKTHFAESLADAVHTYVSDADVVGVEVEDEDGDELDQVGKGRLE